MLNIKNQIEKFKESINFDSMLKFIESLDIDSVDYKSHLPQVIEPGDYGRNILCLEPFECVLIYWPAGVESAVHYHKGFYGYVWVLEGEIENLFYRKNENHLDEYMVERFVRGALIPEPEGIIHKLANPSSKNSAVTIHFYHPALATLEDLMLYDLPTGNIGVLSADAKSATWSDRPGHFKNIEKAAFEYRSYEQLNEGKSHLIMNVLPKPSAEQIKEMNGRYFDEQAKQYDFVDFNMPKRRNYIETINHLVAADLKKCGSLNNLLDIACGTGRRSIRIRELTGLDYALTGVDISEEMCKVAEERGLRILHQDWMNNDELTDDRFDAISFLYAFGHLPNSQQRIDTLKKANDYLRVGGRIYFDLFNRNNDNEWGPLAVKAFIDDDLADHGYEIGDVFYRTAHSKELAFLHYFDLKEIETLLSLANFKLVDYKMVGYVNQAGEILDDETKGSFFIIAEKMGD